ncbi:toxin YdaT family protein [Escherichia coli]
MHSLAYQQGNKFSPTAMIYQNRREPDSTALNIDGIRAAVRAWAADCRSREFVAALIVEEWRASGGTGLDIPTDSHRQMQKVFRWIDGDTEYAANNIRQLAPAIMSVLPLEYRNRLAPQNDTMSLIASAMKECAEAKQAVLLDAPEHQKLKEVSEGIVGLHRSVPAVIARVFFGFDGHLNTAGFDSKSNAAYVGAPFYSKFSPAYGDYQLADNEYRRFLRVKIARNAAGATIASDDRVSLQDVIQTAFNGEAYVTDRKDMTLALNVSPRVSVEELRLIVKLGLLPKPAGVRYDYFYQVTPGLTFGFSRNPSARGFASKFNTAYQGGFFSRKIHV